MSETNVKKVHPLIVRLTSIREAFSPPLTDQEIEQASEIADANAGMEMNELNALISKEFGLQERFDAGEKRENDVQQMITDFSDLVIKWKILPMCDPLVVAGSIIHHLEGHSALMGAFLTSIREASEKGKNA